MNIFSYFTPSQRRASRGLFVWVMLLSLVLQTSALAPSVAYADVVVNVSHADGSSSQHVFASSTDDVTISYTMGDNADTAGTPTLAALEGLLGTLNTALVDAEASALSGCTGTASASASASVTGVVVVDGVTVEASASARSVVTCTGGTTGGSSASASSSSTIIVTTTGGGSYCPPTNLPPVITVLGDNPMTVTQNTMFTDPGATVQDPEDGNITAKLVTTGTVNTAEVGTYTITYNATDTKNLAALSKTRTVTVVSAPAPTNQPPVITVLGDNPMTVTQNTTFTDPSATVADPEDGNITWKLVTTGTVNTAVLGTYTITYNATDTKNLAAQTQTRTVNVTPAQNSCSQPTDTVLIIDRSGSMNDDGVHPEQPLTQAKDAAKGFIDRLSPSADRVSVVSFNETATVNMSLTNDFAAAKQSMTFTAAGNTNIAAAITAATNELDARARTDTKRTIILLSDGVPNLPTNTVTATAAAKTAATAAKAKGYTIYTIGLGTGVSPALMSELASSPAHYYFAPTGADLAAIYQAISYLECQPTYATISGHKYNDANGNGTLDEGEAGLSGWTITMSPIADGVVGIRTTTTNASGSYTFEDISAGVYRVCEVNQSGWTQIAPAGGCYQVDAKAGMVYANKNFFNKQNAVPVNQPPVITVLPPNPMTVHIGSVFTDPSATVADPEDGNITAKLVATGTVNTAQVGNYTITYNATDTKNLAATTKTRTVTVVSACSDGTDNDGDGKVDMQDTGCANPNDDDENTPPVITLIGVSPMSVTLGTTFTDPGANATDTEDCLTLNQSACNTALHLTATGVVNTALLGTYTIRYTAIDSAHASATPVVRTVNVIEGPAPTNQPPVITVLPPNPMTVHIGSVFTDPSATVADPEDGNITAKLVATGTVNTAQVGNYTITYNATDTKNLAATTKTRTVTVVSACSDGTDNDGDGKIDLEDTGCTDPNDDSENTKPVITLIGETVMQLLIGSPFTDPSATVFDAEDGDITAKLVATGTVNTAVLGTYTITYNATDTQNLAADPKTRTVNVYQNVIPGCTANCGGETNVRPVITVLGDNPLSVAINTTFTDPGASAWDQEDGTITSRIVRGGTVDTSRLGTYTITYDVTDSKGLPALQKTRTVNVVPCVGSCGGGGSVSLVIMNEKLTVTGPTTVTVTWNTNLAADSRVVYGLLSVGTLGAAPFYGYPLTTATSTTLTTSHSMVITGIPSALATYFRPVSSNGSQTVTGIELKRTPEAVVGGSCEYLKEHLRMGAQNNPAEVLKLQLFLKNFEGFTTIPTDSYFGVETDRAVRAFQDKYKADVLTPWNLPGNTGYVYYTTKKKINEIYCQREFPLDATQLSEIASFRDLIKRLGAPTGVTAATVLPLVGSNTTSTGSSAGAISPTAPAQIATPATGSVAGAATVSPAAGTLSATGTTEAPVTPSASRGRIALADLLAISPNMGKELHATKTETMSQVSATATSTEGLTEGEALTKQNFLQAAVGSLAGMTKLSVSVVIFLLTLIVVLLSFALYYGYRCVTKKKDGVIEM